MFCECGCGQPTRIAKYTDSRYAAIKGYPRRYVYGHYGRRPLIERFWSKVDKNGPNGCWLWTGYKDTYGYGRISIGHQGKIQAHRLSYEIVNGLIPSHLELDHLCRNVACVNPTHLEAVTHQANTLRGDGPTSMNARQIFCRRGHSFDLFNTRISKAGSRRCRTCDRERKREQRGKV
jgi:hypothetical protein